MSDELMTAATEYSAVVPELWSAKFYPTLLEKLPFASLISRDWEGEIKALGDTVNITDWPQFDVAEDILEDQKADADSVSAHNTQLVINHQLVKDFILTKRAMAQGIDSANALRDLALHAVMKRMQSLIVAAIVPSASAPDHTISFTSSTTLALADILAAKALLDAQDVEELNRQMVVGPSQYNNLFNITGFTSRDFIPGGSPITNGAISTPVVGFNFNWTSELGNVAYFFSPLFMTMAVQQSPDVRVYDMGVDGTRAQRVNLDVLFGLKQMSNLRVVQIG